MQVTASGQSSCVVFSLPQNGQFTTSMSQKDTVRTKNMLKHANYLDQGTVQLFVC